MKTAIDFEGELRKVIDDTIKEVGFDGFRKELPGRMIDRFYDLLVEVEAIQPIEDDDTPKKQTKETKRAKLKEEHTALPRNIQNFVASQEKRLAGK